MDISKKIKFVDICNMLEKIKEEKSHKEKHLTRYYESFQKFSEEFRKEHGEDCKSSFYCVLRCIIPQSDTARASYGLQITTLGNIYTKILQIPSGSNDAIRLEHRTRSSVRGDYAEVVYSVLRSRAPQQPSTTTLFDVHQMLDQIATGDRRTTENVLTKLAETASAFEQKWFVRLLLKHMRLGVGEKTIFNVIHPKGNEYYTRCTDLEKICFAIEKKQDLSLDEVIAPFQHIRPMLCEHLDLSKMYEMLREDTLYTETKMDGERFQLHMVDEVFKYISRNGRDYTTTFGGRHNEGNLTPLLSGLLEKHVKNIILDGEMMVWDREAASFRVKGENYDVKHLPSCNDLRPCFVAYDLLYLNDKSFVEVPYLERVEKLKTVVKEQTGVLQVMKHVKICTVQHFMDIFNNALDANEEGVVIKRIWSTYKPGSRNSGWFKVKADYIQGLTSDMDMMIMGGGYNRTKTYIDRYFVGVIRNEPEDAMFYCVGKVSIGLSREERSFLNNKLFPHWKRSFPPKHLRFGSFYPDVWIEPKNSVIIQLNATELAQASSFATPYVLRFPRIIKIRDDKPWNECMSLKEYERFYEGDHGVKKINKRGIEVNDVAPKRKRTSALKKNFDYRGVFNRSNIEVETSVFSDFDLCVLSGFRGKYSINQLKEIVVKNGGNLIENPKPNDVKCICIAGEITYRVKGLQDTQQYNIVSANWLINVAESQRMHLTPRDMIHMTSELREQFKTLYDPSGDSYVDHVDCDELKALLENLESEALPVLQEHELCSLENEVYGDDRSPNFFRDVHAYFYSSDEGLTERLRLAKLEFQWRGGSCSDIKTPNSIKKTRVMFADKQSVNMNQMEVHFLSTFVNRLSKVRVVSVEWIFDSLVEGTKLPVDNYLIEF